MIVRDARVEDLAPLARKVAPQPLLERYGMTEERLASALTLAHGKGEGLLVVETDRGATGFAWFHFAGTFGLGGYLRLIALIPGAEGQGLGAALLDEVERKVALQSRALFLLVSHWNTGARHFYAVRGYQEVGVVPKLVRDDTDEVICYKRLP